MLPVAPMGIPLAMTWRNISDFTTFLFENPDVKCVVEIGANFGGFSALMAARVMTVPDFAYLGIEIEDDRGHPYLSEFMGKNPRLHILYADCFSGKSILTAKKWVGETNGKALIFCDGTNKPKETDSYFEILRKDDYLMLHDYGLSPDPDDDPGNPSWRDVEPYVNRGELEIATPKSWHPSAGLFLLRRL